MNGNVIKHNNKRLAFEFRSLLMNEITKYLCTPFRSNASIQVLTVSERQFRECTSPPKKFKAAPCKIAKLRFRIKPDPYSTRRFIFQKISPVHRCISYCSSELITGIRERIFGLLFLLIIIAFAKYYDLVHRVKYPLRCSMRQTRYSIKAFQFRHQNSRQKNLFFLMHPKECQYCFALIP